MEDDDGVHQEAEEEEPCSEYEYRSSSSNPSGDEYEVVSSQDEEEELVVKDVGAAADDVEQEEEGVDDESEAFAEVSRVVEDKGETGGEDDRLRRTWRRLSDNTFADFRKLCRKYCSGFAHNQARNEAALERVLNLLMHDRNIAEKFFSKDQSAETLLQVAATQNASDELRAGIVRLMLLQAKREAVPEAFLIKLEELHILPVFATAMRMALEQPLSTKLTLEFFEQLGNRVIDSEFLEHLDGQGGQRNAYWNVVLLVTDVLISIAGLPSSEQELRARTLRALVEIVGFHDHLLDRADIVESLITCVLGMDLEGQSKDNANKLFALISLNPSRVASILISNYAADVLRFIAENYSDENSFTMEQWLMQLYQLPIIASATRELLFVLVESSVGPTLLCAHAYLLKTLIQVCSHDESGRCKLQKLMDAPARVQGVALDFSLLEMLDGVHHDVVLELTQSKVYPSVWSTLSDLPGLCRQENRWSRLRMLLCSKEPFHELVTSDYFMRFLQDELESEASQLDAVPFVRMMARKLILEKDGEVLDEDDLGPFIEVYVCYLKWKVIFADKTMPLPEMIVLNTPGSSLFLRALFGNVSFQRMFRDHSRAWAAIHPFWVKDLIRWVFESIKDELEPKYTIILANWLDAVTDAEIEPPEDIEDTRFVIYVRAALAIVPSSPRVAETWLTKCLRFPISPFCTAYPIAIGDLARRLQRWLEQAQIDERADDRILNLVVEVKSILDTPFLVEWNWMLMHCRSREEVADLFSSAENNNDVHTMLLVKWHGVDEPDRFLPELLLAIDENKARLPGGDNGRDRKLSSPWFLNRVLELYGNMMVGLGIRRGASRVLYGLTFGEASKVQLMGRVRQLATSSEWVRNLVCGLLHTFSNATVYEADGIIEAYLDPVLRDGDLKLDEGCIQILTELCKQLNRFCRNHGDVAQRCPNIVRLITNH